MTQAERLYRHLRRKPHTYLEMLMLGISTCPHKRIAEGTHYLNVGERIVRGTNKRGLVTFRIQRGNGQA